MIHDPMPAPPPDAPPDPAPPTSADARPDPRRFWWLKRGLLALAGVALALLALRLAAGWSTDRKLAAAVQKLRAEGRMVEPQQMDDPPLPDGENAAFYLKRAAGTIVLTPAQEAVVTRSLQATATPANLPLRRAAVAANAKPLADARTARGLRGVDWGISYRSPVVAVLLPQLSAQRRLAELIRTAAEVAAADGDSAGAVERILDLVRLGEAQNGPTIVSNMVGIGITSLAVQTLQDALPLLEFAPASSATSGRSVGRRLARDLIAVLLDDGPERQGLARGIGGERVMTLDMLGNLADDAWLLRPTFDATAVDLMPRYDRSDQAFAQATAASAAGIANLRPGAGKRAGVGAEIFFQGDRAVLSAARSIADRRLAATAVAVRLYQLNRGRLPPTLDALVPDYLPAVPIDPMSPVGGPIRYAPAYAAPPPATLPSTLPAAPTASPRVYSVGEDGLDTGGAGDPDQRWQPRVSFDAPFRLVP